MTQPKPISDSEKHIIEENIYVNSRGQIIIDSQLKDIDKLIPFIKDNIYSKDGHVDAEGIEWAHVWRDYDAMTKERLK